LPVFFWEIRQRKDTKKKKPANYSSEICLAEIRAKSDFPPIKKLAKILKNPIQKDTKKKTSELFKRRIILVIEV
jgi:hypothetical protein